MWRLPRSSVLLLFGALITSVVQGQNIMEFPVLSPGPYSITAGPDGNLWFTEQRDRNVGRITPAGVITEFHVGDIPSGIAAGPDGNLWFTQGVGLIGRITPTGVLTQFRLPKLATEPGRIVAGPDGNLWFTESIGDKIGRITTAGVITEFALPTADSLPFGIAAGPDGNLWFTLGGFNGFFPATGSIGRITPTGVITVFTAPTDNGGFAEIAAGPDGNLWFTEPWDNRIGRITTAGVITEFTVPTANGGPLGIAGGPDGAIWFTEGGANKIGRVTTEGGVTEFPVPTPNSGPNGIAAGPDGNLWFTEFLGNKIGRLTPGVSGACVPDSTALCLSNARFQVRVNWTTSDGRSGAGQAASLTGSAGYFWFFSSDNVEVMVKIVDGRALNSFYWLFAGGLTDANVVVTVTDTRTGAVRTYTNPLGVAFQPIQDTTTFRGP
jgi:streptogramin lyase